MAFILVLCWCVLITNSALATENPALAIARKVQTLYEGTKSFVADFEQEVYWRRGQEIRLSKGKVWFKKPGLMRWEYTWPEPMLIVCDGRLVYVYSQADNQVMVFPSSKALSPKVTLGFMSGKGNLLRDFDILGYIEEKDKAALDLRPKIKNAQVERLRLVVDRKSGLIKEIWFWDYLGNLTKIRFQRLRRNVALDNKLFHFTPPKGVEIIRESENG